uniref:hypothetical protein n=1 Tax=Castellaniella defragrans TaxID=75697 RepID=UPI003342299A
MKKKKLVTQQGFVDACNKRLKKQDGFQKGMKFFLYPRDAADGEAVGVDHNGPLEYRAIYARAYHAACKRFVVKS